MTFKKQVKTLKENWLIIVLVLALVIVLNVSFSDIASNIGGSKSLGISQDSVSYAGERYSEEIYYRDDGFAPEVEDRIKTIVSSLSSEVEKGNFFESEILMRNIVGNYDAFLLNENVRTSGTGLSERNYGTYTIKVDSTKYNNLISDLKEIGEVKSFREDVDDITGEYTNLNVELELEKERLTRYYNLYDEAKDIEDKIYLENLISSQERTIRYLEERINNLDKKVDYSTVYFSLNEKSSGYAGIVIVKLSDLVRGFVDSVNNLLRLIFVIIPWVIVLGIVYWIYRKLKKR
ncbi:MAG: DUF4349 domain-containing protein [Candidatus Pacearchaeota archaeon]|nr:DUF4349 domain-containing protein [Candidatus Pacearchaeota archaeon]